MRSAVVALRALIMLVCLIGIPALAVSTSSWQEIASKFQGVHWGTLFGLEEGEPSSPSGPLCAASNASPLSLRTEPVVPPAVALGNPPPQPPSATAVRQGELATDSAETEMAVIQQQLKNAGATYYLLETWGLQQQAYRFYCRVAVNGNPDYVHCFEATTAEPLAAMREVLQRVQHWRKSLTPLP